MSQSSTRGLDVAVMMLSSSSAPLFTSVGGGLGVVPSIAASLVALMNLSPPRGVSLKLHPCRINFNPLSVVCPILLSGSSRLACDPSSTDLPISSSL